MTTIAKCKHCGKIVERTKSGLWLDMNSFTLFEATHCYSPTTMHQITIKEDNFDKLYLRLK